MRRIAYILTLTLVVAACSGDTTTSDPAATVQVDQAAKATTTTAAPTTTTIATAAGVPAFETLEGTPPHVFDSFSATMIIAMAFDDVEFAITSEGVWVDGSFSCSLNTGIGGLGFEQGLIATPEQLWFNGGNGYEETSLFNSGAQEAMATCPTSPLFWADFASQDTAGITGESESIDGRSATKADITDLIGLAGGLGIIDGFEGGTINEMAMWIDDETGAVLALVADVELPQDAIAGGAEGLGTGPVKLTMDIRVEQINDPNLSVGPPTG